jgi:hypothetical protein
MFTADRRDVILPLFIEAKHFKGYSRTKSQPF